MSNREHDERRGRLTPSTAENSSAPAGMPLPGQVLDDRFLLKELIGRGGTGTVFAALDTRVGQKVAVKVLHPELAGELNHERFRREVRSARPGHDNLVAVFDLHAHDGLSFLSMELFPGTSLKELLTARGTLDLDETIDVGVQATRALNHLHDNGLVHRDVKPGNLLVAEDGRIKLCDLGLARPLARGSTVTETAMVVGTPSYMAPEQAVAAELTPASDIYALGLTLYECVVGSVPLEGDTAVETLMRRQGSLPPRIGKRVAGCPRWFERLLRWMLEADPRERPSATQVLEALERRRTTPRLGKRALTRLAVGAGVLVAALTSGVVIQHRLASSGLDPAMDLMYRVEPFENGAELEILDERGNSLHRVLVGNRWDPDLKGPMVRRVVAFGDLDGDGYQDAVIARQDRPDSDPIEIYLRNPDGTLGNFANHPVTGGFEYEGTSYRSFLPGDVVCADLDGDRRAEILLVENSDGFYPASLRIMSWRNETLFQLWHPGLLSSMLVADRNSDGRQELYVGGTCNLLTPRGSNTSVPVMMALERDWSRHGQRVDLFGPDWKLSEAVPAGVELCYMAWQRVVTASYRDAWQFAMVIPGGVGDPQHLLAVVASDANPANIGLEVRKRPAIRNILFDRRLRVSYAQWGAEVSDMLGIDHHSVEARTLLQPRYWDGSSLTTTPALFPSSTD